MEKKRYALVGTGHRGLGMFARPLTGDFPETAELVAVCDINPLRMKAAADELQLDVPQFTETAEMLRATEPDAVVVATKDAAHAEHVVAALQGGARAISEKPLCTTSEQCRAILAAERASDGTCLVTHNARYGAADSKIREVLRSGRIGTPFFIQFDETLDRCHGADYFRRWHRMMANSGGLLVHKACHHFDCINWWADSTPVRVAAQGSLRFYGANGPFRGPRCSDCPHADECDFHVDLFRRDVYRKLYREAESADGYYRDGCVFDPEIDIYDQMSALIRYENGIECSYTLTAYCPYESQRVIVEGTEGRLEYFGRSATGFASGSQHLPGIEEIATEWLKLYLPAEGAVDVSLERAEGGHGGADPQLRHDFFGRDWALEPNDRMASLAEAVQAVLVGAAANRSIANAGEPVDVQSLLDE
ncbi:MAG: Gfo/Idh/MocA family oxidoreductase [Planctomycetota bacterium]